MQVEEGRNPELRGRPVGVRQKTLIVTTNYVARNLGVGKMAKVSEAQRQFPELVIVDGECLDPYREASERILEVLIDLFPKVSISYVAMIVF